MCKSYFHISFHHTLCRLIDLGSISQVSGAGQGLKRSQTSSRPSGDMQPLLSLAASANAVGVGVINASAGYVLESMLLALKLIL